MIDKQKMDSDQAQEYALDIIAPAEDINPDRLPMPDSEFLPIMYSLIGDD